MVHVIAVITAKPGMRENILALARANLAAVRAEKGCIQYVPVLDTAILNTGEIAEGTGKLVSPFTPWYHW